MTPADVKALEALRDKWRNEAAEADADNDFCCALTRRNDADELNVLLQGAGHLQAQEKKDDQARGATKADSSDSPTASTD